MYLLGDVDEGGCEGQVGCRMRWNPGKILLHWNCICRIGAIEYAISWWWDNAGNRRMSHHTQSSTSIYSMPANTLPTAWRRMTFCIPCVGWWKCSRITWGWIKSAPYNGTNVLIKALVFSSRLCHGLMRINSICRSGECTSLMCASCTFDEHLWEVLVEHHWYYSNASEF